MADDVDGEYGVAAGGVLVHLVRAASPILHAFQKNGDHVVYVGAVHHYKVLNEKAVGGIPAAVQHSRRQVQQVLYLLVVNLSEAGLDCVAGLSLPELAPQFLDGPRDDPLAFIGLVHFPLEDLFFSSHGVGLSGAGLSIGEDGRRVAVDGGIDEFIYAAALVAGLLVFVRTEHAVELVALLRAP